jgi:hypothetical protein
MDSLFSWFSFLLILGFALIIPLANVKSHPTRKITLAACLFSFNLGAVSLLLALVSANGLFQSSPARQSLSVAGEGSLDGVWATLLIFTALFVGQNLFVMVINRRSKNRIDHAASTGP